MKKAYLVDFFIRTRVVVDVTDELTEEEIDELIVNTASNNICISPEEYVNRDNLEDIFLDNECPYDPKFDK